MQLNTPTGDLRVEEQRADGGRDRSGRQRQPHGVPVRDVPPLGHSQVRKVSLYAAHVCEAVCTMLGICSVEEYARLLAPTASCINKTRQVLSSMA